MHRIAILTRFTQGKYTTGRKLQKLQNRIKTGGKGNYRMTYLDLTVDLWTFLGQVIHLYIVEILSRDQ